VQGSRSFAEAPNPPKFLHLIKIMAHSLAAATPVRYSTLRPIGAYAMSGLAATESCLWAVDRVRGYLLEIDPKTGQARVQNPLQVEQWLDCQGIAIAGDSLWFARGNELWTASLPDCVPEAVLRLPYAINGVAIWESTLYLSCQKSGYIHVYERSTGKRVTRFPQPGVGTESLAVTAEGLWLCDREEQTVYCLDRATGEVRFSALTPFASPTGIAFFQHPGEPKPTCYLAYADEEAYIRDDPNSESPFQLTFRDRSFIHPLYFDYDPEQRCTRSNGYLVEISYVEEMLPLEAVTINNVEWRIALPSNTVRQQVRSVEPVGQAFDIEEQDGQQVAVFRFDQLQPNQAGLFGWTAVVEMYGLKYSLTPADLEDCPALSADMQATYLVDDDELAMDHPKIIEAAKEAAGSETNILRKMLKIRNYVYDRLSYGIQTKIDTPDVALERGVGSCGEYVGLLLALARLNGIACRTIGRYKCPQQSERRNLPLEPDFNHVWLEFYVPGVGWLPMESNVDDVIERGPYPTRFFMGLAWYHTEIGKGISFEKMKAVDRPEGISLGDLAINHVRFRILDELVPLPRTSALPAATPLLSPPANDPPLSQPSAKTTARSKTKTTVKATAKTTARATPQTKPQTQAKA
jgi:transglutaminase-like putative cysteine protease